LVKWFTLLPSFSALHEMRNAILVRKSIHFEVKLKFLLSGTPFDELRKGLSIQRKKTAKVFIRKVGFLGEKAGVPKETGQRIEIEGERHITPSFMLHPF